MEPNFLERLDRARELAGVPFVITSGYRCRRHNAAVDGVEDSAHCWGVAADIKATSGHRRYAILFALIGAGFTRIGVGKDFIHCDYDEDKPQRVVWLY
jgi:uncharacterized protein YcbK (DUF882 family)